MKRVYSSLNSMLVDNLYNVLEQEGFECEIRNRHGGSIVGEIPVSEAFVELWVAEEQAVPASQRIEVALGAAESTRENSSGESSGESWRCDQCGRDIDAQFDTCWSCAGDEGERERPTDKTPIVDTIESYLALAAPYRWIILIAALLMLSAWIL